MCPHILTLPPESIDEGDPAKQTTRDAGADRPRSGAPPEYLDGALVTAGATAAESSPQTAPGASAPLSKPALATAPRDEEGPLLSEADPTSNAG